MTRTSLVFALALSLVACSKSNSDTPDKKDEGSSKKDDKTAPAESGSGQPSPAASTIQTESVAYTIPPAWKSAPNPSPMRKATFKIPRVGTDPEDAELSVTTAGGGIDQNVDRWAKQFGGATATKEQRTSNGLKVTVVQLNGTFSSGGMMGVQEAPKPKWALLGAIAEVGSTLYFFKLTGPENTINASKKDFDAFVASLQGK